MDDDGPLDQARVGGHGCDQRILAEGWGVEAKLRIFRFALAHERPGIGEAKQAELASTSAQGAASARPSVSPVRWAIIA